jgi:hypothetical protein
MGKNLGDDLREGATLPLIIAMQRFNCRSGTYPASD